MSALRENVRQLMAQTGLSYKGWAQYAKVPESLGRTLNGLVLGDRRPRVDILIDAAEGLEVEPWQLFVSGIGALTLRERKELNEFVMRYVAAEPGMRMQVRALLEKLHAL